MFLMTLFLTDDLNSLKFNSLKTSIAFKNLNTTFNFIEENGIIGDTNTLENNTTLKFNDANFLTFNTRRNKDRSYRIL